MPFAPIGRDTTDWPLALWSCLQERSGVTWNLAGPDPQYEDRYCTCWPLQIVDHRETHDEITVSFPEPGDVWPRAGEVIQLFGGWTRPTAGALVKTVVDNFHLLPPSADPASPHEQHKRAVQKTLLDLLMTMARLDGESINDHVLVQASLLAL